MVKRSAGLNPVPQIALIGCGYWGKNLCRNLHSLGALHAVVDSIGMGRPMRSIAANTSIFSNFEEVLQNDQIHAIALATPAETHANLAIQAMRAGKDVFVEKPMALSVADAKAMQEVANQTNRVLMVGHLLEYHPAILKLRQLIESGELGIINYIYSNRLNFGKIRTEENALWSFAPHDVAVILRLFGQSPDTVSASGGSYLTPGIADVTISSLRFKNDSRAHIFVSWLHPYKEQKLIVVGDKKMVIFNDVAPFGKKLLIYNQSVEFDGEIPVLKKEDSQFVMHADTEPLLEECRHFLDCIIHRNQPLTDASSGIEVLKVLQACQLSIDNNGGPVEI